MCNWHVTCNFSYSSKKIISCHIILQIIYVMHTCHINHKTGVLWISCVCLGEPQIALWTDKKFDLIIPLPATLICKGQSLARLHLGMSIFSPYILAYKCYFVSLLILQVKVNVHWCILVFFLTELMSTLYF